MNKIITSDQIKIILSDIYRLNPPIQFWENFNKFFQNLPELQLPKVESAETIKSNEIDKKLKIK